MATEHEREQIMDSQIRGCALADQDTMGVESRTAGLTMVARIKELPEWDESEA